MADTRQRTTWGNRFRLMARAFGLLGVLVAATGLCLLWAEFRSDEIFSLGLLRAAGQGANGEFARAAAWTLAFGTVAAVLVAVIELVSVIVFSGNRRTAAGAVATLGLIAALALLVIANVYSFKHNARFDCTRDQRFTLPPELATDLGQLRANAPTTIVVLQMHNTFGNLPTKRDSFTSAAERQVTEKVRDLVDQFREFGPQFNVVVLDSEAFGYEERLKEVTKDAPELKTAIEASPENSIFFHANKRVQRLAFNEFMQLDKTASREAEDGRANLVLVPQGIDRFAARVLSVQERRPKVAVCTVHEALSTSRSDGWRSRYTTAGLRKALVDAGYDVTDIVLKKWGQPGGLKPGADTREESTLDRLEAEVRATGNRLASARVEAKRSEAAVEEQKRLKDRPWPEREAFYRDFARGTIDEEFEPQIVAFLERRAKRSRDGLNEATQANQEAESRLTAALKDERPLELRRMTDISAKFTKQLADVDLLVVQRFTTEDAMEGQEIEAEIHALNRDQVKVTKEFMKLGKPVLVCLGPITPWLRPPQPNPQEPPEFFRRRLELFERQLAAALTGGEDYDRWLAEALSGATDEFERLLAERGVELGNSLVLFDGETKAITRAGQLGSGPFEVPQVAFPTATTPAFKLTRQARAVLQKQGVPETVLLKLDPVTDKQYSQSEDFVKALRPLLSDEEAERFQKDIVKRANVTLKSNPIASAYRLTGRTAGQSSDDAAQPADRSAVQKYEIRLRAIRPIALLSGWQAKQPFAAEIAFTSADGWNSLRPYPLANRAGRTVQIPKYTPSDEPNDPRKGTRDEERRGPFSFAVAVENKLPAAWMTEDAPATDPSPLRSPYERQQAVAAVFSPLDSTLAAGLTVAADKVERPTQRTVVFGSGTLFAGKELAPAQEKLLVHTANWLTAREDRLPKSAATENPEWRYPRVALSDRNRELWRLAAFPGLPLLIGAFGLFVMMLRRMR